MKPSSAAHAGKKYVVPWLKRIFLQDAKNPVTTKKHTGPIEKSRRPSPNVDAWLAQRQLPTRLILICLIPLAWLVATTPLSIQAQFALAVALWVLAMLFRTMQGRLPTVLLASMAGLASVRYLWWRWSTTLDLLAGTEQLFAIILLAAEMYAWIILLLGYFQMLWPLSREPVGLPENRDEWPCVDIFIPTYDEPESVVKPTLFAACGLDWPTDKLRVYLLDDGARPHYQALAESCGAHYLSRKNGKHAKAGNLNQALEHSDGEFILVLDCDHIPVANFLRQSMGHMLVDSSCALVQTPHHFFSADPIERNLKVENRVPNESRLFYGAIQPGNDLWNAAFFCGSCAILRRSALKDIGGFAVETVTEDAHTSIRLHRAGYSSAYLSTPLAAGLATENLGAHIHQRMRWARGMAQIMILENPLFRRGLSFAQRLCYFSSMLHFFNGMSRLVFLTAPLAYLCLGFNLFAAPASLILAYAAPYLILASLASSRIQGPYRHSFWSEIYETLLAWHTSSAALGALLQPHNRRFNVTDKGTLIDKTHFDARLSLPILVLIGFNLVGVFVGVSHLIQGSHLDPAAILLNLFWVVFNLIILGGAGGVAEELSQMRRSHRVRAEVPLQIAFPDKQEFSTTTRDFSTGGLCAQRPADVDCKQGSLLLAGLDYEGKTQWFPVEVIGVSESMIQLRFRELSQHREQLLVMCTFARPGLWRNWADSPDDRPLSSLREVIGIGLKGYVHITVGLAKLITGRHDTQKDELTSEPART